MEEFYIVLEIQDDGNTKGTIPMVYTDINQAYSQWHHVLSIAAVSTLPYHGCLIIRASDCTALEGKAYIHVQPSAPAIE